MNPTRNGWDFLFPLIPKNSLPLTKDLQIRPRNTDSFVAAFCGHALCLAHDLLQGKISNLAGSSQHNGVHAIYSSLKNQGNSYCSFPLAWKSSAASGQVLRLLHPIKLMGYISPVSPLSQKERRILRSISESLPYDFPRRFVFCVSQTSPFG